MKEAKGNLWTYPADWRVITTNGFVKSNGECVMGRGCAREAKQMFPNLPKELGSKINGYGNIPHLFTEYKLITFPVKHNWWEKADPELIKESADLLLDGLKMLQFNGLGHVQSVVMPRPGCGNGQLKWEDVKPLIDFLPDNVTVITFE